MSSVVFLPRQRLLQLGGAKVFFSSFALVLPFFVVNRVSTLAQPRTRTRPLFCRWLCILCNPLKHHKLCILCTKSQKWAKSLILLDVQTAYNKHYVNKTPNRGKIERKNPPRPRLLVGVSVCNPTHILHLFLPPHTPIV